MAISLSRRHALLFTAAAAGTATFAGRPALADTNSLLNVSFDPTAQLYAAYNKLFSSYWAAKTGATPTLHFSHGGSGAQARAVIEGLQADVVTLALAYDIDAIAKKGLIATDWQSRLPDNSTPYTSTVVFLVRKGNPKGIHDWADLVRKDVQIVAPNPKTSGGARWNVLAAWAWALKTYGTKRAALGYLQKFFANVPVLDSGAHGATLTFTQRGIGDVLVGWESDAFLSIKEAGDQFEVVTPSLSILAEPPVALVDKNVAAHGTTEIATEYLKYLYSPEAQDVIGANFFRPREAAAVAKYGNQFAKIPTLVTVADFGGWEKAQADFFSTGGYFDQAYGATGAAFFNLPS